MVGSINNGFQQQAPVFKSLNPGIASDNATKNPVQEKTANAPSTTNGVQQTSAVDNTARQNPVQQFGQDNGLSSRSTDRGQNLDISA
jgi:hypothetical protein